MRDEMKRGGVWVFIDTNMCAICVVCKEGMKWNGVVVNIGVFIYGS
jgi:NADH:ubiquinone oxidoreductase subunit F (NADH-binding)